MQNNLHKMHNLIGPAAAVLAAARALVAKENPVKLLLDGYPGVGKTEIAKTLVAEITRCAHAD